MKLVGECMSAGRVQRLVGYGGWRGTVVGGYCHTCVCHPTAQSIPHIRKHLTYPGFVSYIYSFFHKHHFFEIGCDA